MAINGVYTHESTHDGWPVLKNARGNYCYRHAPKDEWCLNDKFTPDGASCTALTNAFAHIEAKEGPLPVGAHIWQVTNGSDWVEGTLTVGLLVRPLLPAPRCRPVIFGDAPQTTDEDVAAAEEAAAAAAAEKAKAEAAKAAKALAEVQKVRASPTSIEVALPP